MRNYASGTGNIIFQSHKIRKLTNKNMCKCIATRLWQHNWNGHPIAITPWYDDVLVSPSTHVWIPPKGCGLPIFRGIFQQLLDDSRSVFMGSRPIHLSEELNLELTEKSLLLGCFLQELGYVGQCSFDTIIHGINFRTAKIRFVECNGRWGGVSRLIPLFKRLFGTVPKCFVASDYVDPRLKGHNFQSLVDIFSARLFNKNTEQGHYILYNVGGLEKHGKFDIIAIADTQAEAERRLYVEVPYLLDKNL
jgi:hypothetical protein